jgi:isocitrate dehydrogenase
MASYQFAQVPANGEPIGYDNGTLRVPNRPIVPFIEGDGTGPDIWRASVRVFDAAVQRAYGGERTIAWMEVFAGEKSVATTGEWLPEETSRRCASSASRSRGRSRRRWAAGSGR